MRKAEFLSDKTRQEKKHSVFFHHALREVLKTGFSAECTITCNLNITAKLKEGQRQKWK